MLHLELWKLYKNTKEGEKMNIIEIIDKKRLGKELSEEEIKYFMEEYTKDKIPDYQASALLMAICINGMSQDEILAMTMAMANSGEKLDLSDISDNVVDKHSTGGVGDKVTLIISPIVASMGIPVAKMSGRELGITGGTVDKLQSIPAYRTDISMEEFKNNVREIGISLISQTLDLAPADKKLYALRDSTATVNSVPLIASSIMSKKIAAGTSKIVIDVTYGSGAFMKNKLQAKRLAKTMKEIWQGQNKKISCVISKMQQPLGYSVGNTLEVIEVVKALHGEMTDDLRDIVFTMCIQMLKLAGRQEENSQLENEIWEVINSGKAFHKFVELAQRQGADVSYLYDLNKLEKAPIIIPVISEKNGWIKELNAEKVGRISVDLGAGRKSKEDEIDRRVGIILCKKIGDQVQEGEVLAYIHANNSENIEEQVQKLKSAYKIVNQAVDKEKIIDEIL